MADFLGDLTPSEKKPPMSADEKKRVALGRILDKLQPDMAPGLKEIIVRDVDGIVAAAGAIDALPDELEAGERISRMGYGRFQKVPGIVAVTDRRVIFLAAQSTRTRRAVVPLDAVSSVQARTGIIGGGLTVGAPGGPLAMDSMIPKERADELVAEIRARIADRQTTTTHAHPAAEDHAPEVRLRRLADLLNAGLISAEEFEAKRQDVLRDL